MPLCWYWWLIMIQIIRNHFECKKKYFQFFEETIILPTIFWRQQVHRHTRALKKMPKFLYWWLRPAPTCPKVFSARPPNQLALVVVVVLIVVVVVLPFLITTTTITIINTITTTTINTSFITNFTTQHTINYGTPGDGSKSGIGWAWWWWWWW